MKLDPCKFYGIEPELVNEIQWDVDGTHIFKMFTEPDRWINTIKDGRWYKMNTSQLKRLNGLRKTGRCAGSIICQNIGCSKLQTEGILNSNPSDFHIEHGCHVCKCCGYYAIRVYCGCKKVTEYDFDTKEITVWYEGDHNCTPKPNVKSKINFFENLPFGVVCD